MRSPTQPGAERGVRPVSSKTVKVGSAKMHSRGQVVKPQRDLDAICGSPTASSTALLVDRPLAVLHGLTRGALLEEIAGRPRLGRSPAQRVFRVVGGFRTTCVANLTAHDPVTFARR